MNNLLFLGLIFIISIIIYFYVRSNKERFRELNVDAHNFERCKTLRDAKLKMVSPSCGTDNRCDHINTNNNEKIKQNEDGTVKIVKEDRITCVEGMENNKGGETNFETENKRCQVTEKCEDLGKNCGYCNDKH